MDIIRSRGWVRLKHVKRDGDGCVQLKVAPKSLLTTIGIFQLRICRLKRMNPAHPILTGKVEAVTEASDTSKSSGKHVTSPFVGSENRFSKSLQFL